MIRSGPNFLEQLLFPPCCYLCSANLQREAKGHLRYICRHCLSRLPFNLALSRTFPALADQPRQIWLFRTGVGHRCRHFYRLLRRRDPGTDSGAEVRRAPGERPPPRLADGCRTGRRAETITSPPDGCCPHAAQP